MRDRGRERDEEGERGRRKEEEETGKQWGEVKEKMEKRREEREEGEKDGSPPTEDSSVPRCLTSRGPSVTQAHLLPASHTVQGSQH